MEPQLALQALHADSHISTPLVRRIASALGAAPDHLGPVSGAVPAPCATRSTMSHETDAEEGTPPTTPPPAVPQISSADIVAAIEAAVGSRLEPVVARFEKLEQEVQKVSRLEQEVADLKAELAGRGVPAGFGHAVGAGKELVEEAEPLILEGKTLPIVLQKPGMQGSAWDPQINGWAGNNEEREYIAGDLREAAQRGDLELVETLVKAGVNPLCPRDFLADWSCLPYAAANGHLEVVKHLVESEFGKKLLDLPCDKDGTTAVMQAAFWGHTKIVRFLAEHDPTDDATQREAKDTKAIVQPGGLQMEWAADGSMVVLCSAPEFERDGTCVMDGLFELCRMFPELIKFGYDWGGSSTAEAADKNKKRRVPICCESLSCSCPDGVRSSVFITGAVNWRSPKSVAGSQWFPKYITKVQATLSSAAQQMHELATGGGGGSSSSGSKKNLKMVALNGGPVSQLEKRTMPVIIGGGIKDLQNKGMSIGMLADEQQDHEIGVSLQVLDWSEFVLDFAAAAWLKQQQSQAIADWPYVETLKDGAALVDAGKTTKRYNLENLQLLGLVKTKSAIHSVVWCVANESKIRHELPLWGMEVTVAEGSGHLQLTVSAEEYPEHPDAGEPIVFAMEGGQPQEWKAAILDAQRSQPAKLGDGSDVDMRFIKAHADLNTEAGDIVFKQTEQVRHVTAVASNHVMTRGVEYAEFTVKQKVGDEMMVGVVHAEYDPAAHGVAGSPADMEQAWAYRITATGQLRHNGEDIDWVGQVGCAEGDKIGLLLDLDRGSLTVYLNDKRLSVMVAGGITGPLCWMATLHEENEAVRISAIAPARLAEIARRDNELQEREESFRARLLAGDDPMQGASLSGVCFAEMDLSKRDWSGCDFSDCNLARCSFDGSDLKGADLSGATLAGAKLGTAKGLTVAQLLLAANLQGADLRGLTAAAGERLALFEAGADIDCDLSNKDFSNQDLSNKNLSNCNMAKCNLSKCNLTGANLSGANLSGANLAGARLRGARMDTGTRLEGAAGEPADTGAGGVVQGARVLVRDSCGQLRTGVVSGVALDGDIKVTWDATGEESCGRFYARTAVLLRRS